MINKRYPKGNKNIVHVDAEIEKDVFESPTFMYLNVGILNKEQMKKRK